MSISKIHFVHKYKVCTPWLTFLWFFMIQLGEAPNSLFSTALLEAIRYSLRSPLSLAGVEHVGSPSSASLSGGARCGESWCPDVGHNRLGLCSNASLVVPVVVVRRIRSGWGGAWGRRARARARHRRQPKLGSMEAPINGGSGENGLGGAG